MQKAIPAVMMRGGTSRGLYFHAADLPAERDEIAKILTSAMGSYDPTQIDGLGGTSTLTSKVAIISPSDDPEVDVEYFFAQVAVHEPSVDFGPTCGNILSGVGPFAIETGLVPARDGETRVRIHLVNTGAMVEAVIQTPDGQVRYEGDTAVDGVPGTAAPVILNFTRVVGSKTDALFPTGKRREQIDGITVSLVDATMPSMILDARVIGKTGYETREELDSDAALFERLEPVRREAGRRMGLGDVADSVIPKMMIVAPPRAGGDISSRYFVPTKTHAAHAVTGGICLACCAQAKGTVTEDITKPTGNYDGLFTIEHPSGALQVALQMTDDGEAVDVKSAGIVRTARLLFTGQIFVPSSATGGTKTTKLEEQVA